MQVLITGANGFIGKNLQLFLREEPNITIDTYTRSDSPDSLEAKIKKADFIFHLAGVNRPKSASEFYSGNLDLTKSIVDILLKNHLHIPLIYSSSIQAELDNDYGKSKRQAEDYILDNYQPGIIFRLHNVFGKGCRPNYNSVVATFCHNIVSNIPITIDNPKTELNLIYIDDICETFLKILHGAKLPDTKYHYISPIYTISLGDLAKQLRSFKTDLSSISVPPTGDEFTKKLFSTFISYNSLAQLTFTPNSHDDDRGAFTELIHTLESGQVSFSLSHPGISRGNHYHHTKVEKFIVLSGEAILRFRKIGDSSIQEIKVSGSNPQIITIPVGYTHNITNIGNSDMILLIWCNEIYDKNHPDTYYEEV